MRWRGGGGGAPAISRGARGQGRGCTCPERTTSHSPIAPSSEGAFLIQRADHSAGRTEPHESVSGSPLTRAKQQADHPFKASVSGGAVPPPTHTHVYGAWTVAFFIIHQRSFESSQQQVKKTHD